jgi:hypothetical protein
MRRKEAKLGRLYQLTETGHMDAKKADDVRCD